MLDYMNDLESGSQTTTTITAVEDDAGKSDPGAGDDPTSSGVGDDKTGGKTPGKKNNKERINSGPCFPCQISLRKGVLIISTFGICLGITLLVAGATVLLIEDEVLETTKIVYDPSHKPKGDRQSFADALEYSAMVNTLRGFYSIFLYSVLLAGAWVESRLLCFLWTWTHVVMTFIFILLSEYIVFFFGHAYIPFIPLLICLAIEIYFMWIVLAFMEQIRCDSLANEDLMERVDDYYNKRKSQKAEILTTGIYGTGVSYGTQEEYPIHPLVQKMREDKEKTTGSNEKLRGSMGKGGSSGSIGVVGSNQKMGSVSIESYHKFGSNQSFGSHTGGSSGSMIRAPSSASGIDLALAKSGSFHNPPPVVKTASDKDIPVRSASLPNTTTAKTSSPASASSAAPASQAKKPSKKKYGDTKSMMEKMFGK